VIVEMSAGLEQSKYAAGENTVASTHGCGQQKLQHAPSSISLTASTPTASIADAKTKRNLACQQRAAASCWRSGHRERFQVVFGRFNPP